MQMFTCRASACGSWHAQFLSSLYGIAFLDINLRKVHILYLCLTAIRASIFHSYRLATTCIGVMIDGHYCSVVLRRKDCITIGFDIDSMMNLCPASIHRGFSWPIRRSYEHKGVSLNWHTVFTLRQIHSCWLQLTITGWTGRYTCLQWIGGSAKLPSFPFHLLHNHLVILLEVAAIDNTNDGRDIIGGSGIASLFNASSPSPVIIRR